MKTGIWMMVGFGLALMPCMAFATEVSAFFGSMALMGCFIGMVYGVIRIENSKPTQRSKR